MSTDDDDGGVLTPEKLLSRIRADSGTIKVFTDRFVFGIRQFILEQAYIRVIVRQSTGACGYRKEMLEVVNQGENVSKRLSDGLEEVLRKFKKE